MRVNSIGKCLNKRGLSSLACQSFGLTNPVTVTRDDAGAAVAATFNAAVQTART